jgi:NAD(P)-dependent dehydrogenase (short-subunit alcohol dehydrogenase family)
VSRPTIADLISLHGRAAAVTGGARGLGFAIAQRFKEAGAQIALVDADGDGVRAAARKLGGPDAMSWPIQADLSTTEGAEAAVWSAVDRLGRVDVWVNNAGIYPFTAFGRITPADWSHIVDLNLRGVFFAAQAVANHMVERGQGGVIINISSISGLRAVDRGVAVYAATKSAVVALTRNLALELGSHGIRVLAIAPGLTLTEGIRERGSDDSHAAAHAAMRTQVVERQPLTRLCEPDDVARTALFCATDMASFITGHTIPVDGGLLIH